MNKSVLGLGVALLLAGSAHAELYRSVDSQGRVHYSDKPLPEAEVEKLRFGKAPSQENIPYETGVAMKKYPVTLYVADTCKEGCTSARELLNKRGIPYTEKNLVSKEDIDAFKAASGGDIVPVLVVGKTWLKGFQPDTWQQELDVAGYPKNAPYRPAKPATDKAAKP